MKKLKRNRGIWKTILLPGAIGLMCLVMTGAAMAESEAEIPPQEAAVQETAEAVQPVPDAAAPVIPPENPPCRGGVSQDKQLCAFTITPSFCPYQGTFDSIK